MFEKRAKFVLTEPKLLNTPEHYSFFKDQGVKGDNDAYNKTLMRLASQKEADMETDGDATHFDLEAEIRSHPDSLFVKCFAIKADEMNDNGDYFGYDELKKATSTFVGVPIFTNHNNSDAEAARGKVVHSWWDDDRKGIMIIARVDAEAYPQLARGIKEDYIVGCFPPDAPVLMADGTEKNICDIEDGDIVISGKGLPRKVLGTRHRAYSHPLLSVKTEGINQPLVMTAYHNVMVYRLPEICACGCGEALPKRKDARLTRQAFNRIFKQGHNPRGQKFEHEYIQKIPAHELRINDLLIEPRAWKFGTKSCTIKEREAFLMGLFLAEGSYEKRDGVRHSVIFNFGFTEAETLAKKTAELLEHVFVGHRNKPTIQVYPDASQSRVCMYGKDVADWFFNRCGEYSDQKSLGFELLSQPKEILASLIAGYIEGDGWNVKNRTYGLTTASPKLASQFRGILSNLGVRTRYRVRKCEGWGYKPVHEITFGISTAKEIHRRLLYKQADHRVFDSAAWHSLDDVILRRVKSIGEVPYKGIVYDLEIEEDHTYCVNHVAVSNTSMGCQVRYSLCSICHNKAETPDQYCEHIRERKTRPITAKKQKCSYHKHGDEEECPICGCKKGETKTFDVDTKAYEYNYGIKFIENSFVVNPACSDCGVTEVIDPQDFLAKVADIANRLPKLLKVASQTDVICDDQKCMKLAGQQEIQQLQTALDSITSVSQSMLQQKDQLDLEFLSDLVKVLADLQNVTDELTQQGYGRLQSPGMSNEQSFPAAKEMPTHSVPQQPEGQPNIQSGPAGQVGTITAPQANRKVFNLEKAANQLLRKGKLLNLQADLDTAKKKLFDLGLCTKYRKIRLPFQI